MTPTPALPETVADVLAKMKHDAEDGNGWGEACRHYVELLERSLAGAVPVAYVSDCFLSPLREGESCCEALLWRDRARGDDIALYTHPPTVAPKNADSVNTPAAQCSGNGEKLTKPTECAVECPPMQVCDYCAYPDGKDCEAPTTTAAAGVGLLARWFPAQTGSVVMWRMDRHDEGEWVRFDDAIAYGDAREAAALRLVTPEQVAGLFDNIPDDLEPETYEWREFVADLINGIATRPASGGRSDG